MSSIPAGVLIAFLITFLFMPVIITFFKKKNIYDNPGRRKIHKGKKPSMGGIAIFAGFVIASLIQLSGAALVEYKYLFSGILIVFIVGLRDDLIPIKPRYKLLGQLLAAGMVVGLNDIALKSFYGLLGITDVPYVIAVGLSVFTIVVITNSYNLIDGLDGLAGSIGTLALVSFGTYFYLADNLPMAGICFMLAGAILAFLRFNWAPSKIFMGDTGSLFIGFTLAVVAIYFIDFNYNLPRSSPFRFTASVGTAVAFLAMPLFDTLRVFISRALKGRSPFSPDKTHIHHLIMRLGYNHGQTTTIIISIGLLFVGLALACRNLHDHYVILIIIVTCVLLNFLLNLFIKRKYGRKPVSPKRAKKPALK